MKKQEFMKTLSRHLGKLPKEDREDILADFEEYFSVAQRENESEEALCQRLGDPKKIAKEYYLQMTIEDANSKKSFKSMSRAFAASASMGIVNFFYVLCIVIVGYIVIAALYIAACSIGLSGIACADRSSHLRPRIRFTCFCCAYTCGYSSCCYGCADVYRHYTAG